MKESLKCIFLSQMCVHAVEKAAQQELCCGGVGGGVG